jgi:23S rRNA pseudouridine1911/1915/1917 synthase
MKKIIIPEHEAGFRLDAWLVMKHPKVSRTQAQKRIKDGLILVNGKTSKPGHVLEPKDTIEELPKPEAEVVVRDASNEPKIVAETADWAVIEKPPGLLVHPAPNQKTDTLVDFLLEQWPKIAKVGDAPERPGIVHRLDRESSGLMVIAKTQKSFKALKAQFQEHTIGKSYLALVHGKVSHDTDRIETPIGRVKGLGRMAARVQSKPEDKEARSEYDVLERFPHASLVRVKTETGRMHQVRVHMKSIGHPLVGDSLYAAGHKSSPSLGKCPRLFLHAEMLAFNDPKTGDRLEFKAELPSDLNDFLHGLQNKHTKR